VPVTTKAQQNADNADGAENAEVKSTILLGFLQNQWKTRQNKRPLESPLRHHITRF